jgi:hypothetical protein
MDVSRPTIRLWNPYGREIGPVGTAGRIAAGALLIVVPIVRDDALRAWDLAASVTALPLIAAVVAALVRAVFRRLAPRALAAGRSAWSAPGLATLGLVLGVATALTFVTPANEPAIWLFLGISMLVAAVRGQAGCEVLALPNALRGGEDRVDCILFGPVDAAEARRAADAGRAPG